MSIKSSIESLVTTGYHQLGSGSLTSAIEVPGTGSVVMLQAEAQNLRYCTDGQTPTSTYGMLLLAGQCVTLLVGHGNISKIKVIETTAGGILNVTAFK